MARTTCNNEGASVASISNDYEQGINKITVYLISEILKIFKYLAFITASLRNKELDYYFTGGMYHDTESEKFSFTSSNCLFIL